MEHCQLLLPEPIDLTKHHTLLQPTMYAWSLSSPVSTTSSSSSGREFDCPSAGSMDDGRRRLCPIDGDIAFNKHFGAWCCNSCAAFFRRTVNNKRAYVCLQGKNCYISKEQARHMCKYCRFQRCISAGLNIKTAIDRIPADKKVTFSTMPPLKQLVGHQHETYINRCQAAIEVQGGRSHQVIMGIENPDFIHSINSVRGEYFVLNEYLKNSGFCALGLNNEQIEDLSRSIFYSWLVFSSVTSTARNGGFKCNEIFFVDESHMQVDENRVLYYHRTCPNLMDPDQGARIALTLYKDVLTAAQKFHAARLDEDEVASMFQMIAYKGAQKMFPEKLEPIKQEHNRLFECLREHYESNFDCVATKLGNLILLTNEVESLTRAFKDYVLILQLNGYMTVLSTLTTNMWAYA